MNRNSSIERRYSFNLAQSNPVAESTHLGSSFSWGSSWSPRARSNSNICLNTTNSSVDCNNRTNNCLSPKLRNVTKIDARIAADVQSKGLASRIVKYHDSSTRLNRSMSAHNLYSKPGQFPVVTLKKTELPFRATKQELSMIRMRPPEKSTFYGNTISSLLRSNSVVGLQSKRTEENRPIIHPPPTENDMAPTRSVLDVLKEISRKRINSDVLETEEASKKYCNRVSDIMGAGMCATSTTVVANNVTATSQRLKRQRDCIIPHQNPNPTSEVKTSPEQAKKRVCNYNNDITSSLSSSIKNRCNEKKRTSYSLNHSIGGNSESYETQKAKMQRVHDYDNNTQTTIILENMANNLREAKTVEPISPIPKTPCIPDEDIPQKSTTKTLYNPSGNAPMSPKPDVNKPRLTLFNKQYEDEVVGHINIEGSTSENSEELSNCDEYAGIQFVKPKNISISGIKNPLIERTQKSKLALMLSGLRGELYKNSEADNVDSPKEKEEKTSDNKLNVHAITSSTAVCTVTVTLTTTTLSSNSKTSTASIIRLPTETSTNAVQTNTTVAKTTSPLVGLKLSLVKSQPENGINDNKSTDTIPITKVPMLGGFEFSTTTSMSAVVSTTSASKGLINSTYTTTSPISQANNLVTVNQPVSSSTSISVNAPTPKDKSFSLPIGSINSAKANVNTSSLSNTNANTINSLKLPNTLSLEANIISSTTTTNSNTMKPFNFSVSSQPSSSTTACSSPVIFQPITAATISTSSDSFNKTFSTTTNNVPFGTVTTTSNMTNLTPTTAAFSFNQTKTSVPSLVATMPTSNSSSAFTFGSVPTTTSVSTLGVNNNQGISSQTPNASFSFDTQPKTQNLATDDKNNIDPSNKTSNPFNSNIPVLFGTPSLNTPATPAVFGSPSNNSEKNIFGATNAGSTSVFGSSLINNKQVFGTSSESKSSVFGEGSTNNNTSAPLSFGTKPIITQNVNNSSTTGGFSFGSSFSKTSDSRIFGFGNSTKPTTTNNTSSNVFGTVPATSVENKTFVFGPNSNKTENASTSLFGATSNKTSETLMTSGGFSFNSTVVQKPSTFNFGTGGNSFSPNNGSNSNSTSGFSFGGCSAPKTAETSNNKSFSFGTSQPEAQQSSTNIPFSFGTPQSEAQQSSMPVSNNSLVSSNIFGSSAASKTAPPPAFNFNSGSSSGLQSIGQQTSNIFAPPPSNITAGPEKRQIRRATRRLQK